MKRKFPVGGVDIIEKSDVSGLVSPLYSAGNWQASQREFFMAVEGVGRFHVRDGNTVEYSVAPGADRDWVNLYLNGQVLVALLHQRKIINFHASSFIHDGRGKMILGKTGAGKSSLTASFILAGAGFLSDDLTPVVFRNGRPHIMAFGRDIKLRTNTVGQLNISSESLKDAEQGTGKHYLQVGNPSESDKPLDVILKIEIGDVSVPEFSAPSVAEKFALLRSEICLWEMLAGMPETETDYLQQLVKIIKKVNFVRVLRPAVIRIAEMHEAVNRYLDR
ncbi:MAG: hypothetical protein P1P83_14035 [Bacteroidales bacterium]|nr:hypothetical protein [Bacteroidales bacterium]MDT8375053.1 hypothetical protein [Bacteroidales bacterium]